MEQAPAIQSNNTRIVTRVRRAYLFAISIIATISIGMFMAERGALDRFDNAASIINTSGKQRMLSQRIVIYAGKLAAAENEDVATLKAATLASLRGQFVRNHQAIMDVGTQFGSDDDLTEESLKVYYGGKYALDDRVRVFSNAIEELLAAEPSLRRARFDTVETIVESGLLTALDAAVSQFERDAKVGIIATVRLQKIMLTVIMLVLIAELLLIFRPLAKTVETRTHELHTARDEMSHAALHDALTSLPNRRLLDEIMANTLAQSQRLERPMTVCHLDLDYFKVINDTRGHAVGDAVLKHVADVLRETTRSSDFIARVGGDEFVIVDCLLGGTKGALIMAERIIERLSEPFEVEGELCRIGASIGIAEHDLADSTMESALHRADIALYRAKELGRNQATIYSQSAQDAFEERAKLAA